MESDGENINRILPVLFLDEDGEPLQFSVRGSEKHFKVTIDKIQIGGGVVNVRRNGPFTILLDQPTSRIFGEDEVYSLEYISDCCNANAILDLNKYRLNKNSKYIKDFDSNLVLLKKKCWNDIPLESSPEKSIEFGDNIYQNDANPFKNVGRPYNNKERLAIIDYIVTKKAYSHTGGNALWMDMENDEVCEGRTWQSLKEHFKKKILPQIGSYGLSNIVVKKFKARKK